MAIAASKPRVLVLEDQFLIGLLLADILAELNCETVGPAETVNVALALMQSGDIACAFIERSLANHTDSNALAAKLEHDGTPYIFCNSNFIATSDARYSHVQNLGIPFFIDDVSLFIEKCAGARLSSSGVASKGA